MEKEVKDRIKKLLDAADNDKATIIMAQMNEKNEISVAYNGLGIDILIVVAEIFRRLSGGTGIPIEMLTNKVEEIIKNLERTESSEKPN